MSDAPRRRGPGVMAAVFAVVWLAALLVGAWPTPAAAHTDLLQASPAPGGRAGGDVDFVDLVFLEPVTGATVTLFDPNGTELAGTTTVTDGQIIRFVLDEPLSTPGDYDVNYRMTSFDLDLTETGFTFSYDPDAPQTLHIGEVGDVGVDEQGRNWVQIIATVVLVAALAGAAFVFLSRLERTRSGDSEGAR